MLDKKDSSALEIRGGNASIQHQDLYTWLSAVNNFNARYSIPVVVIIGVVGNLLAVAVFLFSPLRRLTTSVYLACQSLTDLLFLIFLGINWLASMERDVFSLPGLCQCVVYVTYVVSFLSLWMIVTLTLDLYASIHWHCLHRRISRPSRALAISFGLTFVACGIYSFSFWITNVSQQPGKRSECLHTGNSSLVIAGAVVDSALTLILPFCLLIYMNVRILYLVATLSKRRANHKLAGKNINNQRYTRRRANSRTTGSTSLPKQFRARTTSGIYKRNYSLETSCSSSSGFAHRKQVSFEDELPISFGLSEVESKKHCIVERRATVRGNVDSLSSSGLVNDGRIRVKSSRRRSSQTYNCAKTKNGKRECWGNRGMQLGTTIVTDAGQLFVQKRFSLPEIGIIHSDQTRRANNDCRRRSYGKSNDALALHSLDRTDGFKISSSNHGGRRLSSLSTVQFVRKHHKNTHKSTRSLRVRRGRSRQSQNTLTKLQRRCLKMVLAVAGVFLFLNVPSHTIRLQSLLRSLLDPSYRPSHLEFELQQLLQFVYYLNYVVNVLIYSACAKNFRTACLNLPWHAGNTVRHIFYSTCGRSLPWKQPKRVISAFSDVAWHRGDTQRDNSHQVDICLLDNGHDDFLQTTQRLISPPCLILLDTQMRHRASKDFQHKALCKSATKRYSEPTDRL